MPEQLLGVNVGPEVPVATRLLESTGTGEWIGTSVIAAKGVVLLSL